MSSSAQFWALLRKNYIVKRRAWLSTLFEIILPTIVLLLLVLIHSLSPGAEFDETLLLEAGFNNSFAYGAGLAITALNNYRSAIALVPASDFKELDALFTDIIQPTLNRTMFPNLPDQLILRFENNESFYEYLDDPEYGNVNTKPMVNAAMIGSKMFSNLTSPADFEAAYTSQKFIPHFEYEIRMNASASVARPTFQTIPDNRIDPIDILQPGFDLEQVEKYQRFGFVFLQQLQDTFIMNRTGAVSIPPLDQGGILMLDKVIDYKTQPFPSPAFSTDAFFRTVGESIGLFFTITFIWTVTRIVASLVEEKELKLREGMKIMGLESKWLLLSWVATYLILFAATCLCITLFVVPFLFSHSSMVIAFIFFFSFCLAVFGFGYCLSAVFSKSAVGSAFSAIIFLCIFFFHEAVKEAGSPRGAKIITSLSPAVALSLGARTFAQFEQGRVGVHLHNLATRYDGYSAADAIIMLLFDAVWLFLLGLYLEQVIPGEYGTNKPWHFLCTRCCTKKPKDDEQRGLLDEEDIFATLPPNEPYTKVEAPSRNEIGKEEVKIRHLRREFEGTDGSNEPFVAVNDLSLDLYRDQITVLLGHNGAGKTTTISMISGLLPVTSGHIRMFGMDLSDINQIRKNMGYCPQHDLLYPTLTVREHLELYADIKGATTDKQLREQMITDIIADVGLAKDNKENALSMSLSGGQKRKLSVAIALLNGSKIVLLDESSSGMDVSAQRDLWKLIQRNKKGRVIILTTHSMEEAEIGDRIAIMAHSRLQCVGSSHFLKSAYGVGYSIVINKTSLSQQQQVSAQQHMPLKLHPDCTTRSGSLIANYLLAKYPFLSVSSDAGNEICFKARFEEARQFPALFDDIEAKQNDLYITSYNMSVTTLTEVFLTVGHGQEEIAGVTDRKALSEQVEENVNTKLLDSHGPGYEYSTEGINPDMFNLINNDPINASHDIIENAQPVDSKKDYFSLDQVYGDKQRFIVTGFALFMTHFKALFWKRAYNSKRDIKSWVWQLLFPSLLLIVSLTIVKISNVDEYPNRTITPELYYDSNHNHIPVTNNTDFVTLADAALFTQNIPWATTETVEMKDLPEFYLDQYTQQVPVITDETFDFKTYLAPIIEETRVEMTPPQTEKKYFISQPITLFQQFELISNMLTGGYSLKQSQLAVESIKDEYMKKMNALVAAYADYYQVMAEPDDGSDIALASFQKWLLAHGREGTYRFLAYTINEYHPVPAAPGSTSFRGSVHYNTTARDSLPVAINTLHNALIRGHFSALHHVRAESGLMVDIDEVKLADEEMSTLDQVWSLLYQFVDALQLTHDDDESEQRKKWNALPSITTVSVPLPRTMNEKLFVSATVGIFIGLAMSFVPSTFVAFLVKERSDKAKHLQIVSGVSPLAYWLSTYAWDTLNFTLPFFLAIVLLFIFNIKVLISAKWIGYTIAAFWLFQLSVAPFVYCFSFLFDSHNAAQNLTLLMGFLLSVILLLVSMIMSKLPSTEGPDRVLRWLYRLLPPFSFGETLVSITLQDSSFNAGSPLLPLGMMVVDAFLFFALLLFVESCSTEHKFEKYNRLLRRFFATHFKCCRPRHISRGGVILDSTLANGSDSHVIHDEDDIPIDDNEERDEDVLTEENKILYGECDNDQYGLVLKGLRKVYPSRAGQPPHVAVNNLYFSVKYGEVFGFLGQNGAGKSTTIKCLVGDEVPSTNSGTAILGGFDLKTQSQQVRQVLGYVPQYDALLPLLTGRQHLDLYARIKCVPEQYINGLVNYMIDTLGINHLADRPAGTYSGGNKRKLSIGIALIGQPRVLCLDEPSSGVDASSRRDIWRLISSSMKGRAVVLVSHSMEETEALCHRIAILTSGNLRAVNSASQLQLKYGDGYQVITKAQDGCEQSLLDFFKRTYDGMEIVEQHGVNFTLKIPKTQHGVKLGFKDIFNCIESNKTSAGIESYSVSDTDLEHIFIGFVERDQQRRKALKEQYQSLLEAQQRGETTEPDIHFMGSPIPDEGF